MNGLFERHRYHRLNQVQYIALGFFFMILAGSLILTLPIASRSGEWTPFLESMFTATSATCVTGLVVYDTFTHWNVFGQLVILLLIQIGGLGFITVGVGFSMAFRRRIGLWQRDLLKESINAMEIGGIVKLSRKIFIGTALCEGAGAILLATRFIPEFGFVKGIYYSIFHAISAFCNAGFDLMGGQQQYASFTSYAADPVINIVLMLLIVVGGLGFVVWSDVVSKRFHWKNYCLHTKMVISVTLILIFGGALLLFLFEQGGTIKGMSTGEQILTSLFGSVTARTAGFNTVDTGALQPESKLLTIVLMFIGGSPGSTAGGVKTTSIAVILIYVISNLLGENGCNVFHRRIGDEVIKKASMVFCLNLFLGLMSVTLILATSNLRMSDVLFEVYSAISTVGMTTGITRDLNVVGRIVIIILMYCGRIGSMTFALSFVAKPEAKGLSLPEEKITIG